MSSVGHRFTCRNSFSFCFLLLSEKNNHDGAEALATNPAKQDAESETCTLLCSREEKKNRLGLNEPPIERELRLENAKREGQCHFGIIESPSPVGRKTKQARENCETNTARVYKDVVINGHCRIDHVTRLQGSRKRVVVVSMACQLSACWLWRNPIINLPLG